MTKAQIRRINRELRAGGAEPLNWLQKQVLMKTHTEQVAATGRRESTGPGPQNLSIRTRDADKIRDALKWKREY